MKSIFLYFRKPSFSSAILQALLPLLLTFGVQNASAALSITSVTLNGGTSVTVEAGESITVTVNETNTDHSKWRSTLFTTSPTSTNQCSDHENNNDDGNFTASFTVTAPTSEGTYNAVFRAYSNNNCNGTSSNTLTLTNAIVVRPPVAEINNTGGTSATNGLHIYVDRTTQIQVRRLNGTGQVYRSTSIPPSTNLDNGVFIRANGKVYGPEHTVASFNTDDMFDTYKVSGPQPANPLSTGVQQTVTSNMGIASGPQVQVLWQYVKPYEFMTADVTLVIPSAYHVSATNPVRYYHVFDTYLGGDDKGCGVKYTDSNGKLVIGTYQRLINDCPSSTSLPAAAQTVESFRERTGQFSKYCVDYWWNFFGDNNNGCSVIQNAPMANRIVSSYQDTGIGIQYDFTTPGIHKFSYDFVIGSTQVPPYDHIEIQHDGNTTLCPDTIKVLACTSSIVPCPDDSAVSTGTVTGTLTASGGPGVTFTPAGFSVGSAGFLSSHQMQATTAGTVILGAGNLSHIPLNGVKCWNTASASQSCSFTIVNTPCAGDFECMANGAAYYPDAPTPPHRNPLYTKVVGNDFTFDVVALQASRAIATGYSNPNDPGVTVELFDDSASPSPDCSAYSNPLASKTMKFESNDQGHKTSPTFNLARAYEKLRCRVTDPSQTPAIYGCSTDNFAVRPKQFTVTSTNATNASSTGTPAFKADRDPFNLTAFTGVANYSGTPTIDNSKIIGSPTGGVISGGFSAVVGGAAVGNDFTYSEVGNFGLGENAVHDDTFTQVDQASGDCTIDFSNAEVNGKYGCKIGSAAIPFSPGSSGFGRFIPDHFNVTITKFMECPSGLTCPNDPDRGAAYARQGFITTVTAFSLLNSITTNYQSDFDRPIKLSAFTSKGGVIPVDNSVGALSNNTAENFTSGVADLSNVQFAFASLPGAPVDIYLRAEETGLDADGITSLRAENPTTSVEDGIKIIQGRLRLTNAFGTVRMPPIMPVRTDYWSGNSWVNWPDGESILKKDYFSITPNLAELALENEDATGPWKIRFDSPEKGSANVCALLGVTDANLPWLQNPGDPCARVTFGIYPAESKKTVHIRELY